MFKALMGGGRSSSDVRSTTSSSSKSRRKTDSKSSHSRKSSRGDDRDRGLGDLSAYEPSVSGSRRGPASVAGESVASTYVTAEPDEIDPYPAVVERAPKRRDSDRDSIRSSRRRHRDRSESRDRDKRKSRRSTTEGLDDDWERDRRERRRTQSGDHYMPPVSMPSSAPGAQFAADIAAPGFSQFPMQYDNTMAPAFSAAHESTPSSYDPHVQQQFPGQFPTGITEPYLPYHPAGAAADYYGDQGQSVSEQPGVRPQKPLVNSQDHLMAASPAANPPPEPSSLGQVGAAAAYFDDATPVQSVSKPPSGSSSKPSKPGKISKPSSSKPSKPSKPSSSSAIPAAAAAGAATYGIGSMMSHEESQSQYSSTSAHQSHSYSQGAVPSSSRPPGSNKPPSSSKPPHSYGVGTGIGIAAAGAAAGYMFNHNDHHDHPENSAQHSQYNGPHYDQSSQSGLPPYASGSNNVMSAAGGAGYAGPSYAQHVAHHGPGYYPQAIGAGGLAMQHRQRGPLTKFVDFWRDPEGVGRFEDYTETIGVCRYCFDPQSTSLNAPRKHHYNARRHSSDRYSSSSNSRVNKLSRYHSSEDERGRRKKSKKSSSWLPGMLAGYAAKSIFAGKDFDDSYSVRSGRPSGERTSSHDETMSYTSRGVVRRSERNSPREYYYEDKRSRRPRSRSSSRSRHSSFMKEAALGAAVGGAALAVSKHQRDRSRSTSRIQRRKDSSSSSSFVDVSRPAAKSAGGFTSFFTSTSENRRKTRAKRSKSFFSFRSSSSSSLDNDLAFGDGFSKKPNKLQKKQEKGKKREDVDAALLGLGATATALAASHSHGRSRSTGQILTARDSRSRHSDYGTSANEDDEWIDAGSDDHSSTSAHSGLAFGGSSGDSSSDSNSGRWGWGWGKKKEKKKENKKEKKSSIGDAALAAGAGALGGAALASVARRRDSRPSSSAGSLQQVYPVPTSDPSRFDVGRATPSVISNDQTPLVRPGLIPLQQPQPVTPVSQAVYSTQGSVLGSIPAYSTPSAVPPIFANEFDRYGPQNQGSRDASWHPDDASYVERRHPRRSNSSPVFPIHESTVSSQKRRSTIRDQASVSFNLTEEQAERERRLSLTRRERESRDDFRDEPVQLIDREKELARLESERRDLERKREREERDREREREERDHEREMERRRKDRDDEKRRSDGDKEKDSSKWVEAAAIGAIGAAAATSIISHKSRKDEEDASEASSRRRERRRAERRAESSVISKPNVPAPVEPPEPPVDYTDYREEPYPRPSPRPAQVYDDYAEFYAPEEIRHSPDEHSRRRGSVESDGKPDIVEVVPASEREKEEARDEPTDLPQFGPEPTDLPQFGPEPYENREHLPWPVPQLNFIDPTPPQSINGSVRGGASPVVAPVQKARDAPREVVREEPHSEPRSEPYEAAPREKEPKHERSTTGSRVSWGPHSTHEYEVPSSSEPDFSPTPDDFQDISIDFPEKEKPKDIPKSKDVSKPEFGDDIEFAATVAAATEAAGFDPSFVIDDPKYHKRTSPPGSEDEGTFSPTSKWAPVPEQHHGFIEGEIESPDVSNTRDDTQKHVIDKDPFYAEPESFCKDNESSKRREVSIAQEVIEQLNGKHGRSGSPEVDVLSMPGGFDSFTDSREVEPRDDRSVFSAPPARESEKSMSKKSRRSGDDLDLSRDLPRESSRDISREALVNIPSPAVEEPEIDDKEEKRRKRRSKQDSDVFAVDDDARSAITSIEDVEKAERRKHRSSRSRDFDDAASIASSPAKFDDAKGPVTPLEDDEKSERRKHRSSRSREFDDAASAITAPEDDEKSERRKHRRSKRDSDTYSVDDDARSAVTSFEDGEKSERRKHRLSRSSRDVSPSTPLDDDEKSERRRHRSRSSRDFDDAASAITTPEDDGKSERRKHRRSKRDSDTFSVDDGARSAITSFDDIDKSERRKHRSRSSRDFDDTASISSSPAKFDETREKRRSKDDKELKEKSSSGGLFRSLFGSRVSEPARSRSNSRSSSVDKRPSREAMSEAGIDDERRRRKKKHRSSSGGESLRDDGSDKESVRSARSSRSEANLEEYRSSRQKKEERRRNKYEDIVDSGRRRESEKDAKPSDYNDDSDKSFLGDRPELPAAAERDQSGASGLEKGVAAAAGLALGGEVFHQLSRSRSTSAPGAERALDLAPRSHSRPTSPKTVRERDGSPRGRRPSVARSVTESPTAVPLHFRRPPTSPGLPRAVPVTESPTAATVSPGSPTQPRHRRLNSVEFRNSREIRPLWLVERHGATKGETAEPGEPLPSLPSSKTSSRAPSMEDLRALNDEDAIQSWDAVDFSHSIPDRGRSTGLTISTDRANAEGDDLLDSQQATPTAEDHGARKEKHYEFHSPSELLQDPSSFPEMPLSPSMEALPSAEGSAIGTKDMNDGDAQERTRDLNFQEPESQHDDGTPTQEKSSFDVGPGFAGVVDAAVAAAAEDENTGPVDKEIAEPNDPTTPIPSGPFGGFADIVNAAVSKEVSHDQAPTEDIGEPGTALEEQAPQFEAIKEVIPETTEVSEPQSQLEEAVEEVATTSASKKKKKKKGKKGPSQSVDETTPQPTTSDEQAFEGEARSIEPEAALAPAVVEEEAVVQPEPEAEQLEVSKGVETETFPAEVTSIAAIGPLEAVAAPEPEVSAASAEPEPEEPATAPESQPKPTVTGDDSVEPEVVMTAAEKRKAKKAAKKKAKSISSIEEVGDVAQPFDDAAEEAQALEEKEVQQDVSVPETPQNEQDSSEFHDSRETAETPIEEPQFEDANKGLQEPVSEAREIVLPEPALAEAGEDFQTVEEAPEMPDEVTLTPAVNETPTEEDNFQEAVEEQAEQPKDLPSETPAEITEPAQGEPEVPLTAAQKKKAKKDKKKRQSLAVDEAEISTEPKAADPESEQVSKDLKHEQSGSGDHVDTQDSLAGGETLFSDPEKVPKDLSDLPAEELAAPREPESIPSGDVEPVAPTEPVESTEITEPPQAMSEPPTAEPIEEVEAGSEVPMTAAQKKKAKKDKKKKAKQSISSSLDDEKPAEPESTDSQPEAQSIEAAEPAPVADVAPADITQEAPSTIEETPVDVTPLEETKEIQVEPEQTHEDTAPVPAGDISAEIPAHDAISEAALVEPEGTREISIEDSPVEPEVPMTAAEKRKAKKAAKKKQQSIGSVTDETPAAETTPTPEAESGETPKDIEATPETETPAVEEAPAPTPETEAVEPAFEAAAPADASVEEVTVTPLETDQTKDEDLTPAAAVETVPEAFKPEVSNQESEAVEPAFEAAAPADASLEEVTVTPLETDESKDEDLTPAAAVETVPEAVEPASEAAAPADAPVEERMVARVDTNQPKDEDLTPAAAVETVPEAFEPEVSNQESEAIEPSSEAAAPADAPVEEGMLDSLHTDQPNNENMTPATVVETTPEAAEAEPEVPMTAAEKRKAKKAKKKQQKLSVELDEPITTEHQDADKATDAPETEVAAPGLTSAEAESEVKTEAAADVETHVPAEPSTEDALITSEPPLETPADVQPVSEEAVPEPARVDTAAVETVQEENKNISTNTEPTLDKSPEEIAPEQPVDQTTVPDAAAEETAAATSLGDPPAEEFEVPMTAAQKKKAKKDKKKRQSLALVEEPQPEPQPEPVKNETTESASAEDAPPELASTELASTELASTELASTELASTELASTELASTELASTELASTELATEDPASTENVGVTAAVEEPIAEQSVREVPALEETAKVEPVVEEPVAEPEAPAEPEPEVAMTAAQKKKAKKDKKKRQSMGLEAPEPGVQLESTKEEQPAPTELAYEEPASTQAAQGPVSTENIETPVVEVPAPEESAVNEPVPEASSTEKPATEEPIAEPETPTEFEAPLTAAQKKKAKKDNKKRQYMGLEEPQAEPVTEQPAEAAPNELAETPGAAESVEAPTSADEPVLEEASKGISAADEPVVESETPAEPETPVEAESEIPMTAAQKKKAKKDKKKNRKSVAFEDEAQPEQEPSTPVENVEYPNQPTADATASQEMTDAPVDAETPVEVPADKEIAELETPFLEATEAVYATKEPATPEALVEETANEPEPEPPVQPEEKTDSSEQPSETAEAIEALDDSSFSAKERRKLKKKEKKKGKSVDLTEEVPSPSTEAPPETLEPDTETSKAVDTEVPSPDDKDVALAEEDQSSKPVELESSEDNVAVVENDPAENTKFAEPDTTAEPTNEKPAAETLAELEPTPSKEEEPEADAGLSAKERRKLKKKQKRQSKNIDADAAETESAPDSPTPETAAVEPLPLADEIGKSSPESNAREITEPVTATSPAENDGKELQSRDTETPDTPAQNLASTDEFLSSQVEQPQIESRSSDYPPQSVLERSIDFGDATSGDARKEEDVITPIPDEKVSIVKETPIEDVEGDVGKSEEDVEKVLTLEEERVEGLGIMDTDESVSKEGEVIQKEPKEESPPETAVDAPASTEPEPAVEEAFESALSKKQKKKDKKKKQKQQQEEEPMIEGNLPAPMEVPATTETEQPGSDHALSEEIETTQVPETLDEPVQEPETILAIEDSPAKQADDVTPSSPRPFEEVESSEDVKPTEDKPALEAEQVEEAPISRKLSKKEKKKQQREALLAQQAAETLPEDKLAPEPTEPSDSVPEVEEEAVAPAQEKALDVSDEAAAQTPDVVEDTPKEDVSTAIEEVQPTTIQEAEKTESVIESLAENMTEAPVPIAESPIIAPVEPQEEQPTVSRKMSKKEKKATAAAAAVEEEKPVESEPKIDELTTTEPVPDSSKDEAIADDFQQAGPKPSEEIIEQPAAEETEQAPDSVEETPAEPTTEAQEEWPTVSRKMSKKEKKKAAAAAAAVAAAAEVAIEREKPAGFEQAEAVPPAELTATVKPKEPVAEPESTPQDEPVEGSRELEPETVGALSAHEPEQSTQEAELLRLEEAKEEAVISLDPFDMPSSVEQPGKDAEEFFGESVSAEKQQEQNEGIEAKLQNQALEKETDLEVAGDLFEDRPRESEDTAPVSRKMSKKEKRKAKKKGVEIPLEHEEELAQEPIFEEAKEEEFSTPAPEPAPETIAEPEIAREAQPEPELESSKAIDLASNDPQAAAEPLSEPEVVVPELAAEEPETSLSRKASKKKAKKAKKGALTLDDEPTAGNAPAGPEPIRPFEPEESAKSLEADVPESITRELKQDEEEFPTIEWEHGKPEKAEPVHDHFPEPELVTAVPDTEAIGEFDESAIPEALRDAKKGAEEPVEEDPWSMPLSKKDKKKAKKNKRKSEQATLVEELSEEPPHKMVELASDIKPEPMEEPVAKEVEIEPPVRTTTPGGSKIANLFPGLERAGFRRSAVKKDAPSVKDSAEEETAADLEANRDIAIPVLEALPLATTESREIADTSLELPTEKETVSTITDKEAPVEEVNSKENWTKPKLPVHGKRSIADEFPSPEHPASEERSSMLFGLSPSALTEEASSPRHLLPSQMEAVATFPSGLSRSPSVIHGKHQHTPRTWNLEDQPVQAVSNSSPPRSLFGPFEHDRPRTPLDTIAEHQPGDSHKATTARSGTPRLEIKPEYVLPRPVTPVRKFTDNALERKGWPTPENESGSGSTSQDNLSKKSKSPLQTPELGAPVLRPSDSKGKLRRTNRSTSSDLRAASRALDSPQPPSDLDQLPSSSSYDPVTDKGKRPLRNMSDVYEGWGETPSSPRSPSRPPSVRRRRSMQHLQDLEGRLDQLISENRLLIAARDEAEDRLRNASVGRRKSDRALKSSGADLRDREAEVEQLKSSVEWFQKEMARLTQENEGLTASNAALAAAHVAEVTQVRETSTRELDTLRSQHNNLSSDVDARVRQEIQAALAQKDTELRRLRQELEEARDKVKELQQQIAASITDNALVFRDEDYFDAACQKLCGHVQQWVLRFSKHSDHRRCRSLSELNDEKLADRFDNALLDGSDADAYLSDRVRRRDVFMSVVMTMVWEYIFTRYLFGMDREQRQKLKSLEKQLGEVGPSRAVHRWRATTLTLLSNRPAFASQRDSDTEAVALEIFGTLSRVLPPPSQVESQLLDSLRKVLRVAVKLSLEMRTQLAEFIMLPPLQPEYDTNGDLARQVYFNASLMNERSGETSSNDELESQQAVVRIVLFPLVVKKGNDVGEGDDEVVVCPAQVLIARAGKDKRLSRMQSGDRMSIDGARSVHSVAPSIAPSTMDMNNVI